ncbi:class A beta-lactamase-related serine hydrolase [Pseudonocardiaceae bacterium YIM PH 21723]|nr:class A beta-lactamase-related serine hydrolase [Pseudonocardiaceae bacterium YIM PH 21723]
MAGAAVVGVGMGLLAPAATAAPAGRDKVQQAMEGVLPVGALGIQLRLRDAAGEWTGSAGRAAVNSDRPVRTDGLFRIGSNTKTFTATVVLQLNAERRVDLDAPVNRYLPGYLPVNSKITVRNLLQHTSGIYSHTGEEDPAGPGIIPPFDKRFVDTRYRTYTPEQMVRWALAQPSRFNPGEGWSYSNTNYVLLGMLIEKLTGHSYAQEITQRILRPLHLRQTSFPGTHSGIPGPHAQGYLGYPDGGGLTVVDITRINPSWGGAAGEMISSTRDLERFYVALLAGELLPAAQLTQMMTPWRDSEYGLGLHRVRTSCGDFYGHTGGIPGYVTDVMVSKDRSKRMVLSLTDSGRATDRDTFLAAFGRVGDAAVCG